MQLVSWNCRGLGNPFKVDAVKDLLRMVPSNILLLQETKVDEEVLLLLSKNKWKLNPVKALSARGTSGGLATLWCEEKFHLKKAFATQHWIFTELLHSASKISISLFNLYVLVNYIEKQSCWKSLSYFLEVNSLVNLVLVGDLNIYMLPSEKKVGSVVGISC